MGFEFTKLSDRMVFEHKESDTLVVMRLYRANDPVGEADLDEGAVGNGYVHRLNTAI